MKIELKKDYAIITKDSVSESFLNLGKFKRVMLKMISESKFDIVFKASLGEIKISLYFITEAIFLLEWYISSKKQGHKDFVEDILKLLHTVSRTKDYDTIKDSLDYGTITKKMNFSILEHQKKAFVNYIKIKEGNELRGYILEAGIGTGKTFSSLALTEALDTDIRIIVCQSVTISEVWVPSLQGDMYKDKYKRSYYNVKDGKGYNGEKDIICNYEQLKNLLDIINDLPKGKVAVIVDEIHKFNDVTGKSQRPITLSRVITKIQPDDVILLSGTPIKYSPKEMTNLLRLLDPMFTREVEKKYNAFYKNGSQLAMFSARQRYSTLRVKINKTEMTLPDIIEEDIKLTFKNSKYFTIEAIRGRLKDYTSKRVIELNKDLPLYNTVYEKLRNKAYSKAIDGRLTTAEGYSIYKLDIERIKKAYKNNSLRDIPTEISRANSYEKEVLLLMLDSDEKIAFKDAKSIVKYIKYKVAGEAIGNIVTKARMDCAIELVNAMDINEILNEASKKVIFFTKFKKVAEEIYKDREAYIIPVYGEHLKIFKKNMIAFRKDHRYKAIVATYNSLSTGVTVTEANVIVMTDLVHLDFEYQQAIGRAHRLGQDTTVYIKRISLDTGEEPNITNRDIDIMSATAYSSSYITGLDNVLDALPELNDTELLQPKAFIEKIRNNLLHKD